MKIPESLIALLRCPETHQSLALADAGTLLNLNQRIATSSVNNCGGNPVEAEIEAGLIREDQLRLYPIKDGFPLMLIEEAIDLK